MTNEPPVTYLLGNQITRERFSLVCCGYIDRSKRKRIDHPQLVVDQCILLARRE